MFSPDSTFSRFMSTLLDVLVIGILWFVCSLPLITIAASTTAAYYAMAKVVRHKTGYLFKEYFRSFKANFKQSLVPAFLFLAIVLILIADIIYVWNNRSSVNDGLFIVMVGITFIFLSVIIYFCPFLSRFTKKNFEIFRLSAFSAFRFLPVTISVLAVIIFTVIGIYLMPWAIVVFPGLFMFLLTYPMEFVISKYMKKPEPGSPEEDKWYFQKTESFFAARLKERAQKR